MPFDANFDAGLVRSHRSSSHELSYLYQGEKIR